MRRACDACLALQQSQWSLWPFLVLRHSEHLPVRCLLLAILSLLSAQAPLQMWDGAWATEIAPDGAYGLL